MSLDDLGVEADGLPELGDGLVVAPRFMSRNTLVIALKERAGGGWLRHTGSVLSILPARYRAERKPAAPIRCSFRSSPEHADGRGEHALAKRVTTWAGVQDDSPKETLAKGVP